MKRNQRVWGLRGALLLCTMLSCSARNTAKVHLDPPKVTKDYIEKPILDFKDPSHLPWEGDPSYAWLSPESVLMWGLTPKPRSDSDVERHLARYDLKAKTETVLHDLEKRLDNHGLPDRALSLDKQRLLWDDWEHWCGYTTLDAKEWVQRTAFYHGRGFQVVSSGCWSRDNKTWYSPVWYRGEIDTLGVAVFSFPAPQEKRPPVLKTEWHYQRYDPSALAGPVPPEFIGTLSSGNISTLLNKNLPNVLYNGSENLELVEIAPEPRDANQFETLPYKWEVDVKVRKDKEIVISKTPVKTVRHLLTFPPQASCEEVAICADGNHLVWLFTYQKNKRDVKPDYSEIWISQWDGSQMEYVGSHPCKKLYDYPRKLQWQPDDRGISFVYNSGFYTYSLPISH